MKEKLNLKRKNKPGKFIISYTIQLVMIVYYAKFDALFLHSSCEIFDEILKMDKLFAYLWINCLLI